ncbi:MAG: hypothetical protein ABWZ98_02120, partial [Nakamurella sp.]
MDTRYLAHLADPDFYDLAWTDSGPADLAVGDAADAIAANGQTDGRWRRTERGPWLVYRRADHGSNAALPDAGWKVHVAVRPERAPDVVPQVVLACLRAGVEVKSLRSTRLVRLTQGKYAPVAGSGKVVTAYPTDDATLERLLGVLTQLLHGEPGVRLPGEIPVPDTPMSLRYGAFRGLWVADSDGRAVPGVPTAGGMAVDRRAGPPPATGSAVLPSIVRMFKSAAEQRDRSERLDIRDAVLLHRSTAGGVYRAVWSDGRAVVVKEARHHTGFDASGADAAARLRHEHAVLQRLSGSGVAPLPVCLMTVGDSDFLIMEFLPGRSAATVMAVSHPGIVPGAATGSGADYRQWVATFQNRVRTSLTTLHSRGVVHRDLHPGNLIDMGDRVMFIDLEAAALDGFAAGTPVGGCTPESVSLGVEADLRALDRLQTVLINPLGVLLDARPELADTLLRVGQADLDHDGSFTPLIQPPSPTGAPSRNAGGDSDDVLDLARLADRVAAGIALAATPARPDRMFPGDIAQFFTPHAALGLLHGAGGVLLALAATGRTVPDDWTDRLLGDCDRVENWTRGLADGVDGVALCLGLLGHRDVLGNLVDRLTEPESPAAGLTAAPWWASGRVGMAVVAAELALLLAEPGGPDQALTDLAHRHVSAVIDAVDAPAVPAGHRPGLLTGWAGVALGLLRVAELSSDNALIGDCRNAAHRAVQRELSDAVLVGNGVFMRDRTRIMPYLGIGSAAVGLASQLLEIVGKPIGPELVPAVIATLRRPVVLGAGLLL